MTAAVFLDRDGVLNAKMPEDRYVTSTEELRMLPGVGEALRELRRRVPDVRLIVVTNQRGVARGHMTLEDVDEIHAHLRAELATVGASIDDIYVCPHEHDSCDCRKPRVGLFEQAVAEHPDIDIGRSVMVGDSLADLQAGTRMGLPVYLVASAQERPELESEVIAQGIAIAGIAPSLMDLVQRYPGSAETPLGSLTS